LSNKSVRFSNFFIILMILFFLAPVLVIIPASFGKSDMFSFPPSGFTLINYVQLFQDDRLLSSLFLSLYIGVISTFLACLVGLLSALGIVKGDLPFKGLLESLFMGPLIIPTVTTGIGFLIMFVPLGLIGSPIGIIMAHSVIISPYIVRIAIASLRQSDSVLEEAAVVHGANAWYAFYTVVLPQLIPSLISGALLAFIFSFDEFTVTNFLAQADTVTLPIRIYQYVRLDINPIVTALASVTVVVSFIVIVVSEKLFNIHKYLEF
jgi:putative spermidine/putrescine transport system permease protein